MTFDGKYQFLWFTLLDAIDLLARIIEINLELHEGVVIKNFHFDYKKLPVGSLKWQLAEYAREVMACARSHSSETQ